MDTDGTLRDRETGKQLSLTVDGVNIYRVTAVDSLGRPFAATGEIECRDGVISLVIDPIKPDQMIFATSGLPYVDRPLL